MTDLLPCVEVGPAEGAAHSVIWLHGLGANGHDFEPIVPLLEMPTTRFVFPQAPVLPVTINMGMTMPAWYDILTLDESPTREPPEHILASAALIEALVAREKERGVPAEKIVGGLFPGRSHGAAHGFEAFGTPCGHHGFIGLFGFARSTRGGGCGCEPSNPCFCHGTHDPMVPCRRGKASMEAVHQLNPERPLIGKSFHGA